MVEVFKTNVQKKKQAASMLAALVEEFPSLDINFDLEDCDRILRVEGKRIHPIKIIQLVKRYGYKCAVLE